MNSQSNIKLSLLANRVEVSPELTDYVHRRAQFGLGRFSDRIRGISVRLNDINGPRGGFDKTCDIRVDAGLPSEVFVSERQSNFYAAVAIAMARAEKALKRRLAMHRESGLRSYRPGYSLS